MGNEKRDNLLVTMAMRMAYMDCAGRIFLMCGLEAEDEAVKFIAETVDKYLKDSEDVNFDLYIEEAILANY